MQAQWSLAIAGDGPARAETEALFSRFGSRVTFLGVLDPDRMVTQYRAADLLVWPGIGEAFGMVYLEAQAEACPVLAEDRPGVRDVVRDGGWLVPPQNPSAFAQAVDRLAGEPQALREAGRAGHAQIAADHLLGVARATLVACLEPLIASKRR